MREYLKAMRSERGLTLQNIADKLGITKQYYQLIENGERQQNMDITLACKIADVMGVSLTDIVENERMMKERSVNE